MGNRLPLRYSGAEPVTLKPRMVKPVVVRRCTPPLSGMMPAVYSKAWSSESEAVASSCCRVTTETDCGVSCNGVSVLVPAVARRARKPVVGPAEESSSPLTCTSGRVAAVWAAAGAARTPSRQGAAARAWGNQGRVARRKGYGVMAIGRQQGRGRSWQGGPNLFQWLATASRVGWRPFWRLADCKWMTTVLICVSRLSFASGNNRRHEKDRRMLKFLHTADWQIGRVFARFDEDDAAALFEARFKVIERIATMATQESVDAVLVAGDVFDAQTVADKTIRRMFLAMAGYTGPWVMIPGNHDAALAESVWERARRLQAVPANVVTCLTAAPHVLPDKCVLLPAPLTQRHTHHDLTAWFDGALTEPGLPRIGLAHGSVSGILAEDIDSSNPIAADRVVTARLDYLALGDWHGAKRVDARTWYAGTPETDRFKGNDSGQSLLVTIAAAGAEPQVRMLATGDYRWRSRDIVLAGPSDVERVLAELGALGRQDGVQMRLSGSTDLAGHRRLRDASAAAAAQVRALLWDDEALRLEPTDDDIAALDASGYVGEVLAVLRAEQTSGAADAEVARDALLALARVLADNGRVAA